MRFELDTEVNALYVYFREIGPGEVGRIAELATSDIREGFSLDIDSAGRAFGLEFFDADDFYSSHKLLTEHCGKPEIFDKAEDLEGFGVA